MDGRTEGKEDNPDKVAVQDLVVDGKRKCGSRECRRESLRQDHRHLEYTIDSGERIGRGRRIRRHERHRPVTPEGALNYVVARRNCYRLSTLTSSNTRQSPTQQKTKS